MIFFDLSEGNCKNVREKSGNFEMNDYGNPGKDFMFCFHGSMWPDQVFKPGISDSSVRCATATVLCSPAS